MRSDKPSAKAFQHWVAKVVLPATRKDGGYIHGEERVVSGAMSEERTIRELNGVTLKIVEVTHLFPARPIVPTGATIRTLTMVNPSPVAYAARLCGPELRR